MIWPVTGPHLALVAGSGPKQRVYLRERAKRAGEGNRTLMTSLEGWGSAIELRPR
jgi:hypothetical protein